MTKRDNKMIVNVREYLIRANDYRMLTLVGGVLDLQHAMDPKPPPGAAL